MAIHCYYLGGPVWANKHWVGSLYPRRSDPSEWLSFYSEVFNTVEGNSTFYALPDEDTFLRWRDATHPDFRFCFKVPREVTHEAGLTSRTGRQTLDAFYQRLALLPDRVGMVLIQLPPGFGGDRLGELKEFLQAIPRNFPLAVEARHPEFYDRTRYEPMLDQLLSDLEVNRGLFDTEVLHGLDPSEAHIVEAQSRKPENPGRFTATGRHPVLRFVGHDDPAPNLPRLRTIARQVADWILEDRKPFVFLHSPDDRQVPQICRHFHGLLSRALKPAGAGEIPPFPGELEPAPPIQLDLF